MLQAAHGTAEQRRQTLLAATRGPVSTSTVLEELCFWQHKLRIQSPQNNDRELTDVFYLTLVQLANNCLCLTHLLLMDGSLLTVPFKETVAQCMQG